jgi:cytochrome P450
VKNGQVGGSEMFFSQRLDCWVVEGYAAAVAVMREPALEIPRLPLPAHLLSTDDQVALAPLWEQAGHLPLYSTGSAHRRLRGELRAPFTRDAVDNWRPLIRQVATELVVRSLPSGRIEVIEDLGRPLLRQVMAEVIGIPESRRTEFDQWTHAAVDVGKLGTPHWSGDVGHAASRATDAIDRLVEQILDSPNDMPPGSVLGTAAARRGQNGGLSTAELAANARSLYTAGVHTTIFLIASAAFFLFADETALKAVRRDRATVTGVVHETLRFASPAVEVNVRRATRDVTVGRHDIRKGQFVRTVVLRAARDPAQFHDPDVFDHRRPHAGRTLAFGVGPHVCLGNHLATAIAEETCAVLADVRYAARLLGPHPTFVRRGAIPVMWGPEWVRLELGPADGGGRRQTPFRESVDQPVTVV